MTSRVRWIIVTWGLLTAVWTATVAYQTNLVIPMPQLLPPLPVTQCSNLIPGDLQAERWVPRICYVPEP